MAPRAASIRAKSSSRRPTTRASAGGGARRRHHHKSRNGCLECKRRHIKCDEVRPKCSNCVVSERACEFPLVAPPPTATSTPESTSASATTSATATTTAASDPSPPSFSRQASQGQSQSPAGSNASPGVPPHPRLPSSAQNSTAPPTPRLSTHPANDSFAPSPVPSSLSEANSQPIYTTHHLLLLHHAETGLYLPGLGSIVPMVMDWAEAAPYALEQLLAFAADHRATVFPERAPFYRHSAAELQTRALSRFNRDFQEKRPDEPADNAIPRFLFASLLSVHLIFETFANHRDSFHMFIEKFTSSAFIHRGLRAVTHENYRLLATTKLGWTLRQVQTISESSPQGTECDGLTKFIESSDLGPTTIEACKDAASRLQWAFNLYNGLSEKDRVQAVTAFPVLISAEFVDSLRKHRPEALVVLAYYGVLLHLCRGSWIVNDAGQFVIHLIADYLGNFWQDALRYPLSMLEIWQG